MAHQAPLSLEFSRQEYWSGLPFPSPADLPNPGIKPWSPALQADSLPSEPLGKPILSPALNVRITSCREPAYCIFCAYCILSAALSTASSFRIWNSSTVILSLPGASVRNSAHDKGHEEGGSAYAKAGSSLRSPPGNSRASTPKPESAYFLLCAFTYTSDFMGAVPHYLSLKKELAYSSS